ncbi:L-rhamnose mutarotase [Pontibacter anaerobius]|uniref:L-rhamnose mutarotase n=1 Tax=Pontibacter anaerobius TaxID=2993940 RepID=A0ABT3RCE5_9BACT|nr:L-rhamnose mutarotase [Pontibacter anaerobius]MCX2739517.1 L-rhamnose mutarotase [Pontibacter anaerobius]
MKRYCMALDLKDDPKMIAEYVHWHQQVWPEVKQSLRASGVESMEIYHFSNRLFMIIEADNTFSFEAKAARDKANPVVQEWEQLMWKYQLLLPGTREGEKWVLLERIFSLEANT